ncbi:hypothetical protein [Flavobacterium sp.]|uniref:hypothetical protein n=1 Tax=Flavobacterium sp. TaxID=239 RepID=UPI003526F63B
MNYLKISQFIYLLFALFFAYQAFAQYRNGEDFWLSVVIALVAFGMFLFRRNMFRKHQNRNNK